MADQEPRSTYLIKQLQWALRLRLDEIAGRFDLTTCQYTTLGVLAKHPRISSAQLARLTFVSPQAANQMVATLERKGYLERPVDATNRRCVEVHLTRAGIRTLAKCDELIDRLEAQVFDDISGKRQAEFRDTLRSCLETISRLE
jgi:DNA-binding MarR family transcriptional regulator